MDANGIEQIAGNGTWAKIHPWMMDGLGLRAGKLLMFALMYERQTAPDSDSAQRIDAAYIAEATGFSPEETVKTITQLTSQHLIGQALAADGLSIGLEVDMEGVAVALRKASEPEVEDTPEE